MLHSKSIKLIVSLLYCLFITSCKKEEVDFNKGRPTQRWKKVAGLTGLKHYEVLDMISDASGSIWVAFGQDNVVGQYDGKSWTMHRPFPTTTHEYNSRGTTSITQDKNGNIWASITDDDTYACQFDGKNWTSIPFAKGQRIQTINEVSNGDLWFGSDNGTYVYNSNTWSKLTCNCDYFGSLSSIYDKEGVLWMGGDRGMITKYDGTTFTASKIPYTNPTTSSVVDLSLSASGEIYAAVTAAGAWKFNGNAWELIYAPKNNGDWVMSVMQDSKGRVWIGTYSYGLFEINGGKVISHDLEPGHNSYITKIIEDKNGVLWVGNIAGVFKYE